MFSKKFISRLFLPLQETPRPHLNSMILTLFNIISKRNTGTSANMILGLDYLRDPKMNKGLGFTHKERQILGIYGLVPHCCRTQDEQAKLVKMKLDLIENNLDKYLYLNDLRDYNERLFFRLVIEHSEEFMPIVYTPTVGLACQKFGLIYRRPRGLFISIGDIGHVYDVMKNWPHPNVKVIIVTDGERILGLGDLGAHGMGIPVGKLDLVTALAGVPPYQCLGIQLDVGTDNQKLIDDPYYIGLRKPRIRGELYDQLVQEFMESTVRLYGQNTLIQFEDFGNSNAFRLLKKYKDVYCCFNDDIQGTGAVVLSGLLASPRLTGREITDHVYLFAGAGEAGCGIADALSNAMASTGLDIEECRKKIWMFDQHGLLTKDRKEGDLKGMKGKYVKDHKDLKTLEESVKAIKPSVLIGATGQKGLFTTEVLKNMGEINEQPIIFALSNPTSKAECTAEEAYTHTDGRVVFSSGSPFPPFTINNKTFKPGQGNNAYIFPGMVLGIVATETHHVPDDMFLCAARIVAESVTCEDLEKGSLYPPISCVPEVSLKIAAAICDLSYEKGLASLYPEPENKKEWLKTLLYSYKYESVLPLTWGD